MENVDTAKLARIDRSGAMRVCPEVKQTLQQFPFLLHRGRIAHRQPTFGTKFPLTGEPCTSGSGQGGLRCALPPLEPPVPDATSGRSPLRGKGAREYRVHTSPQVRLTESEYAAVTTKLGGREWSATVRALLLDLPIPGPCPWPTKLSPRRREHVITSRPTRPYKLPAVVFTPTEWAVVEKKMAGQRWCDVVRKLVVTAELPPTPPRPAELNRPRKPRAWFAWMQNNLIQLKDVAYVLTPAVEPLRELIDGVIEVLRQLSIHCPDAPIWEQHLGHELNAIAYEANRLVLKGPDRRAAAELLVGLTRWVGIVEDMQRKAAR